ncbi:MAG: prolipoprotein diacylglyceryl transferase [Actinomycetota bacterium]|nr:prolipoprotein diacylglyceryl transferase [Actinomycetota bacterium]
MGVLLTDSGVAFSIGPVTVRWYGLIITAAVLAGYAVAYRRVKARGQDPEHLINILVYGLISAIVGARFYYVLFSLADYLPRPAEALAVWHGGLAIHGALIGGIISTVVYTRRHGLNFWYWADILAPSIILGQAIGRWGNYMNQEAFGGPTRLPWGIYIEPAKRPLEWARFSHFHPTFLYESLWSLAGFAILLYLSRRQTARPASWPNGSILLVYAIYYSIGRFFVEGLRTDSLMLGPIRVAQLVSLALIIICSTVLWRWRAASQGSAGAGQGG